MSTPSGDPQQDALTAIVDPDGSVRANAFIELEDCLAPEMLPLLEQHLPDPAEMIRRRAPEYVRMLRP